MKSWMLFSLLWLIVVPLLGGLVHWFSGIGFILATIIVGASMMLNGFLAEWEDRQPGGFYNPKGKREE